MRRYLVIGLILLLIVVVSFYLWDKQKKEIYTLACQNGILKEENEKLANTLRRQELQENRPRIGFKTSEVTA